MFPRPTRARLFCRACGPQNLFRPLKSAGARAFPITETYYNLYVDSWIYDSDKEISGAKVQYAECTPSIGMNILPEWNTSFPVYLKFGDDNKYAEHATHTFDKNVKIDANYDIYNSSFGFRLLSMLFCGGL